MITVEQEKAILQQAYVPEHIVSLMALLSKGEPFLMEEFLCFARDDWLIVVGYPLGHPFEVGALSRVLEASIKRFRPTYAWFIAQEMPHRIAMSCTERETDAYYVLDLGGPVLKSGLLRVAKKASEALSVERSGAMSQEHRDLMDEFLGREKPSARVRRLFLNMPEYVGQSTSTVILDARDQDGRLAAFYVVELAANAFATYVLGCHSKQAAVRHASDLLFLKMIELAREQGKDSLNLGLGVNEGIRRFKAKWGGKPFLKYEFCECVSETKRALDLIRSLGPRY